MLRHCRVEREKKKSKIVIEKRKRREGLKKIRGEENIALIWMWPHIYFQLRHTANLHFL
jgi:hypothetical protein